MHTQTSATASLSTSYGASVNSVTGYAALCVCVCACVCFVCVCVCVFKDSTSKKDSTKSYSQKRESKKPGSHKAKGMMVLPASLYSFSSSIYLLHFSLSSFFFLFEDPVVAGEQNNGAVEVRLHI